MIKRHKCLFQNPVKIHLQHILSFLKDVIADKEFIV